MANWMKNLRKRTNAQDGVTLLESLVTLAIATVVIATGFRYIESGRVFRKTAGAVLTFYSKVNLLNDAIRDPVLCESLNIIDNVTADPTGPDAGQSDKLIAQFSDISFQGPGANYKIFDKADNKEIEYSRLEIWQRLAPVGISPPYRVPLTLEIHYKVKGSSKKHFQPISFMGSFDAGMKLKSCFLVVSRRIVCEDMGWVFDPSAGAGEKDCLPP
jgi:prepilin-type N-terminal cleavage/methylation domain-containing protein